MEPTELSDHLLDMGRRARAASYKLAKLSTTQKNRILLGMAEELESSAEAIITANARDMAAGETRGLSKAMLDRLHLDQLRIASIAKGVREVAELPDPTGEVLSEWSRPNGLRITKVRVPIGVIGIIFESRPNVTVDAAILCFKTGNATLLRGGSEAIHSNLALAAALQRGGEKHGLPPDSVQLLSFTDREGVKLMAEMDKYLDVIIPRGGKGLIEAVVSSARMPVIKHYDGVCHVYVHEDADLAMAEAIVINSKCQKPGVCNALETLLVHEAVAGRFYPQAGAALLKKGVELRGDEPVQTALPGQASAVSEGDWTTEYLDLILSVKTVANVDEAIDHINRYGSHHTDAIITEHAGTARRFQQEVDSAVVLWNASTRFNDGGEFGFGAEIGISTDKLHARGPMGLAELTSYKYLVKGNGQVR